MLVCVYIQTYQLALTRYWTRTVLFPAPRSWICMASYRRDPLSTPSLKATTLCFPNQELTLRTVSGMWLICRFGSTVSEGWDDTSTDLLGRNIHQRWFVLTLTVFIALTLSAIDHLPVTANLLVTYIITFIHKGTYSPDYFLVCPLNHL